MDGWHADATVPGVRSRCPEAQLDDMDAAGAADKTGTAAAIELIEADDECGEQMFFAWGVHDPVDFLAAVQAVAWWAESSTVADVQHMALLECGKGKRKRWEPVQGEANATVLYCD